MRKCLILLSALVTTTVGGAPAWTWVDADGQVHYSDRPVPGARQVELAGAQSFGSAAPTRPAARPVTAPPGEAAAGPYTTIDIVSPAEQETLWNIGAVLTVQVRFQPALQPGHRYDVALDGLRTNQTVTGARIAVQNVFRGTHTLQVIVFDSTGTEVMRSPVRNFVVQQTSVLSPSSQNARPTPPPPRPTPR
jgi:hypothetical protein